MRIRKHSIVAVFIGLLIVAQLLCPRADAKPLWELNPKGVSRAVEKALVGKRGQQLAAARLVNDPDPAIKRGLTKLIAIAGVTADAAKRPGIPPGIVNGLGRLIDLHDEDAAKQFLKDVDQLYNWAKNADRALGAAAGAPNMRMLGEMSRKFGARDYNNWKGAWFELQLSAFYAKGNPPILQRLQPLAPGDPKNFRDAGIMYNNIQAYIEAKNWTKQAIGTAADIKRAADKLAAQIDSHFLRLQGQPHLVGFPPNGNNPVVPPGLKLVYDFSERMPAEWKKRLMDQAVASLQKHFKDANGVPIDETTARNWVDNHLHFRVCSGTPFNCVDQL